MATTRREFIKATAGASISFGINTSESIANTLHSPVNSGFSLLVMGTRWGFNGSIFDFCEKAKQAGYDGIELWWPESDQDTKELYQALEKNGLKIGFLVGSNHKDFKQNLDHFKANLKSAALAKPVYINCHSGKDFFSFDQNKSYIDYSIELSASSGTPIYHETHRGRILYAATIARQFIEKIPHLRLTLDISHWCNVHESLLEDQEDTIAMALSRADHIHARVGHPEGPQVNDPRAPEWKNALNAHLAWWDKIVELKKQQGKQLTILTEFGPADYMQTLPYTKVPVANQWEINVFMKDMLKKRYL